MIKEIKEIQLNALKKELENVKDDDYELRGTLKTKIEKTEKAKTISDLGLNLEEAKKFLEEHDIPFVLEEEDKAITEREGGFQGLEDFILVHETRYQPTQNRIKSPKEAGARIGESITLKGKEYKYEIPYMRNTVHFAVNDEVNTSHGNMNIDGALYAILIPMIDAPKERLKGTASDMYTFNGGVEITPQSYILCLKGEGEKVKQDNPNAMVIECEGNGVNGYAKAFLSTIGYKQTDTGWYGFIETTKNGQQREKDFIRIMKENKIENRTHMWSEENTEEIAYKFFNRAMAICHIIKENGLINKASDKEEIMQDIKEEFGIEPYTIKTIEGQFQDYIQGVFKDEEIDSSEIMKKGSWSVEDIVEITIQHIIEEKNKAGIEKIKGNFKKWAETRDLEEEKITLDDVYAQYEQHIEKFPTNENIFANAFLETFRAMKRENETEARKMATEIVIFSLKERTKIGDRLSPETEEKAIRLSETWNAAGKEINLPEMTYYEGELIPWGWCKLPKVTQRGIQELPPPPTSTVEVPKNLPPVPIISISEIRDTIKEVRVSEVTEAREIIEESMKQVEKKSTEKKETETIEPEI